MGLKPIISNQKQLSNRTKEEAVCNTTRTNLSGVTIEKIVMKKSMKDLTLTIKINHLTNDSRHKSLIVKEVNKRNSLIKTHLKLFKFVARADLLFVGRLSLLVKLDLLLQLASLLFNLLREKKGQFQLMKMVAIWT